MSDLIERDKAIDALDVGAEALRRILDTVDIVGAEREKYKLGLGLIESCISDIKELPSAQPERILYANMSDAEFEAWLYGHGICNPNIHESIPCDVVPLLIDNAISELPSAQPEPQWIPCSDCERRCDKWERSKTSRE